MPELPVAKDYTQRSLEVMPTAPGHYVQKKYVDVIAWEPVIALSPVPVTLTGGVGPGVIDGFDFTAIPGPVRVALANQANSSENGIYIIRDTSTLVYEKTDDFNPANVLRQKQLRVMRGATYGDSILLHAGASGTPVSLQRTLDTTVGSQVVAITGDGSRTLFTVLHTLGTKGLIVAIYQESTGQRCRFNVKMVSNTAVEIDTDQHVVAAGEVLRVVLVKASDDSGKGTMAPSGVYDDIPWPTANTTVYTAPADGWLMVRGYDTTLTRDSWINIENETSGLFDQEEAFAGRPFARNMAVILPCGRGDRVRVSITTPDIITTSRVFRFIYSKSTIEQVVTPIPGMVVKSFITDGVAVDFEVKHSYRSKNVMVEVHDENDVIAHFGRSFPDEETVVLSGVTAAGTPIPAGRKFTVLITGVSGGGMVPSTKRQYYPLNFTANTPIPFTAPGNGYLKFDIAAPAVGDGINVRDVNTSDSWRDFAAKAGINIGVCVPCYKGQALELSATLDRTANNQSFVWFIYAKDSDGPPAALDYSNAEQFTGKRWLDGKKVYQRTFTGTATGTATAAGTLSGLETLVSFAGSMADASDYYVVPADAGATQNSVYVSVNRSTGVITLRHPAAWSGYTFIAVVEYTKTTD